MKKRRRIRLSLVFSMPIYYNKIKKERNKMNSLKTCPSCNSPVKPHESFCPKCGMPLYFEGDEAEIAGEWKVCPGCGTLVEPDKKFCHECGMILAEESDKAGCAAETPNAAALKICPGCNSPVKPHEKFCPECGMSLFKEEDEEDVTYTPTYEEVYKNRGYDGDPYDGVRPPMKVSFAAAVKNYFKKWSDFSGRAVVGEYWWSVLFNFIVEIPYLIVRMTGGDEVYAFSSNPVFAVAAWYYWIVTLVLFIPGLSVTFRRLHDTGRSGVYFLFSLIPVVGWIILLFLLAGGSDNDNQWGAAPEIEDEE